MCLVFVAFTQKPECPLLILFNRDEQYNRPTMPLSVWQDHPTIMGGRDLLRGGTWAGVSRAGRFACVTFVRTPYESAAVKRSRGKLVSDYLLSDEAPLNYLKGLRNKSQAYWGYNILVGSEDSLFHYNNYGERITELRTGIHGVSNATLDTPWPKVLRGKQRLAEALSSNSFSEAFALEVMSDRRQAVDAELPSTGIPLARERKLSAPFVSMPAYGTKTTSLIQFFGTGGVEFVEWTHQQAATPVERRVRF